MGEDIPYPRGHMPFRERIVEAFKDREMAAEAVIYASACGAATCMEDGAIAALPPAKLVEKMVDMYGDDIVIQEEDRDFELPDMQKQWWSWRYSGQ